MKIDQPLDAIVSSNFQKRQQARRSKQQAQRFIGRKQQFIAGGRGRGRGMVGKARQNFSQRQPVQRVIISRQASVPRHQVAQSSQGSPAQTLRIQVQNLDFQVSEQDMRELFGEGGHLKSVQMAYDQHGKSQGRCDIVFTNKATGLRVAKKYSNVPLDGRKMRVQIVGGLSPVTTTVQQQPQFQQRNTSFRGGRGRGSFRGGNNNTFRSNTSPRNSFTSPRGRGGFRGRGRGRGAANNGNRQPAKEEDLDKQLDAYLAKKAI